MEEEPIELDFHREEIIKHLGYLYKDPRDALGEFVTNSIDKGYGDASEERAGYSDLGIIYTLEELYPAYYGSGKVVMSLPSIWKCAGRQLDRFIPLFNALLTHEILHHLIEEEDIEYSEEEEYVIEEVVR